MDSDLVGTFLGIFLTFCLFSFLYRDNPFYKFAEHLFIGISIGYYVSVQWHDVLVQKLWEKLVGNADPVLWWGLYTIPALLCVMMFARYVKSIAWLGRLPIAFVIGSYVGLNAVAYARGQLIPQTEATIEPILPTPTTEAASQLCLDQLGAGAGWLARFSCNYGDRINAALILIGVCSVLLYFFFSRPHERALGVVARVGILFLMLAFGASFGFTVMGRIALAVGRAQDALETPWLSLASVIVIVLGLVFWSRYVADPEAAEAAD